MTTESRYVIKKDGTKEPFNIQKVITAVNKSSTRVLAAFTPEEMRKICNFVERSIEEQGLTEVSIPTMHNLVEGALEQVNPKVAKSYRDYRNYKQDFVQMLDEVYQKSQSIMYIGDKENSNADSALVSTKRSLILNELNKSLYKKFFLTVEELQACRDGYIYIHDMSARRDTMNCCLFDVAAVLRGGFEMGNLWYNEPKTLDVAFDVIGDIVLSAASSTAALPSPVWTKSWSPTPRPASRNFTTATADWAFPRKPPSGKPYRMCRSTLNRASRAGNTSSTPWPPAGGIIPSSP